MNDTNKYLSSVRHCIPAGKGQWLRWQAAQKQKTSWNKDPADSQSHARKVGQSAEQIGFQFAEHYHEFQFDLLVSSISETGLLHPKADVCTNCDVGENFSVWHYVGTENRSNCRSMRVLALQRQTFNSSESLPGLGDRKLCCFFKCCNLGLYIWQTTENWKTPSFEP